MVRHPMIVDGRKYYSRRCHKCDEIYRTPYKYSRICAKCDGRLIILHDIHARQKRDKGCCAKNVYDTMMENAKY